MPIKWTALSFNYHLFEKVFIFKSLIKDLLTDNSIPQKNFQSCELHCPSGTIVANDGVRSFSTGPSLDTSRSRSCRLFNFSSVPIDTTPLARRKMVETKMENDFIFVMSSSDVIVVQVSEIISLK